jgi:hypothetical protein
MPSLRVVKISHTQEDFSQSSITSPKRNTYNSSHSSTTTEEVIKSFAYAYPSGLPLTSPTEKSFNLDKPLPTFPIRSTSIPNTPRSPDKRNSPLPPAPLTPPTPSTSQMRDWVTASSSLEFGVIVFEQSPGGWKGLLRDTHDYNPSSPSSPTSSLSSPPGLKNTRQSKRLSSSSPRARTKTTSKSELQKRFLNSINPNQYDTFVEVYVVRRSRKVKERAYVPPPTAQGPPPGNANHPSIFTNHNRHRGHSISAGFSVRRLETNTDTTD